MIRDDILSWTATLPKWEQIIAYAIIEKKPITEDFLAKVFSVFKIEMKLEDGIIPTTEYVP